MTMAYRDPCAKMDGAKIKIKKLFEKILEPNYIMNSYYSESLINKLGNCTDPEISCLVKVPLISDLVVATLDDFNNYNISVRVFIIRLLATIAQKELHFAKTFAMKGDNILKQMKEINSPSMNPSLRVAYMEVALALVHHDSGVNWLLETSIWKEILSLCNERRTVFVVRQTYAFASRFLWKLNDINEEANVKLVLDFVLKALYEIDFLGMQSVTSDEEEELFKRLEPMLQILLSVTSAERRIEKPSLLMQLLIKEYNILSHLLVIFDRVRKEDLSFLLVRVSFWTLLAKLFLSKPMEEGVTYDMDDFMEIRVTFFNIMHFFIRRRCPILVLDYCIFCNTTWNTIFTNTKVLPSKLTGNATNLDFQFQILFIFMVPPLLYVKKKRSPGLTDEGLHQIMYKLFNASCEHTARAGYALRDLVMEMDILSITLASVKRLTYLKMHLNNEQANLVFQILYYVLEQYDPLDCTTGEIIADENYEDCQEEVQVMTYVMDTVQSVVKTHNIIWSESIEIVCLYSVVYNILKRSNLTCKFVVASLNVIALTVKKFLQPNLSLLLDSKPGTAMHGIGKLIYMKMHDLNWEVRDSALELLHVCTEISYIKFPPFQRQILENNLINVAAAIAFNDHEYYVQVSALKCLSAASKVSNLWEQLVLQFPNIQEQLIGVLCSSQEGIVRKEACSVLCDIYQNIKMTPTFKNTLYEHMVSSALSDFHWEVQLSALKFWKVVIQSCLTDQGMLDGRFPPVTFSRSTRKIVSLNKSEIQRRLLETLEELASIGCLTVLIKLLRDDYEVDVMDTALTISLDLLSILENYEVPDMLIYNEGDSLNIDELTCRIKEEIDENEDIAEPESVSKSDSVIDGILDVDDMQLLANIYNSHMKIQNENTSVVMKPKIQLLKKATPYLFVTNLKSKDFKAIVDQKKKWKDGIKSLQSLLDDAIGVYELNDDVNDLDCY